MYAVIQTGGKQYRVAPGDELRVEKLAGEKGDMISFDRVILTSDGENVQVGRPYLENIKVMGRVLHQGKDRKVIVFKFKRRKGYRRTKGHRQPFSLVRIERVEA